MRAIFARGPIEPIALTFSIETRRLLLAMMRADVEETRISSDGNLACATRCKLAVASLATGYRRFVVLSVAQAR